MTSEPNQRDGALAEDREYQHQKAGQAPSESFKCGLKSSWRVTKVGSEVRRFGGLEVWRFEFIFDSK